MDNDLIIRIIVATISTLLFLIAVLLVASVIRRVRQDRYYRRLDALQAEYRRKLLQVLEAGTDSADSAAFAALSGSDERQAVENVLLELAEEPRHAKKVHRLFRDLGYAAFYEGLLSHRNILIRSAAADKLGRMRSVSSTGRLVTVLEDKNPEFLSVVVRALSKIGTEEGLRGVIDRMPFLLGKSLVTRKAMETSLLNFGSVAVPLLIGFQEEHADPWITSCILETLSHLPADNRAVAFAAARLESSNAEVRSKALKVLERAGEIMPAHLPEKAGLLLDDPVWFVRLQAIRATSAAGEGRAAAQVRKLLFDENWQVRNEAARALSQQGDRAIAVFLDALTASDGFAKESVCEEIEKSGISERLIQNLISSDETLRTQSRDVLKIMHSLHFSTPLVEYVAKKGDERIKREIGALLENPQS